jgi:hypothetical protein
VMCDITVSAFSLQIHKAKSGEVLAILSRVQKVSASNLDLHTSSPVICDFFRSLLLCAYLE